MNIFVLDYDIDKCAEYHCDRHIVKMITETAQILSSVYYFTDEEYKAPYKLTHINHPCCVWARESLSNWVWLRDLGIALYNEYKYRYNDKMHKAGEVILTLEKPSIPDNGLTKQPQVMPEYCRRMDVVEAYRNYYIQEKQHILKYTRKAIPEWLISIIN
jgi:hypothetical protein